MSSRNWQFMCHLQEASPLFLLPISSYAYDPPIASSFLDEAVLFFFSFRLRVAQLFQQFTPNCACRTVLFPKVGFAKLTPGQPPNYRFPNNRVLERVKNKQLLEESSKGQNRSGTKTNHSLHSYSCNRCRCMLVFLEKLRFF